jgi:hypothetical protein
MEPKDDFVWHEPRRFHSHHRTSIGARNLQPRPCFLKHKPVAALQSLPIRVVAVGRPCEAILDQLEAIQDPCLRQAPAWAARTSERVSEHVRYTRTSERVSLQVVLGLGSRLIVQLLCAVFVIPLSVIRSVRPHGQGHTVRMKAATWSERSVIKCVASFEQPGLQAG